jgi:hypothetical protein
MIIAIDESGNFHRNSNKFNLFVAAHILSLNGNLEIKQKQFESWENTVPAKMKNKKGEVKGQLLGKVELKNFIKNVVYQKPEIRFTYISVIPKKNNIDIIRKHQKIEICQLQLSLENFKKVNSKKVNINFFDQFSKWLNKRNENEYLKLRCLGSCLYNSFYNSFIYCIALNRVDELLDIEFKIDKDFIDNENIYWNTYSLRSIQNLGKTRPLPMLSDWPQDHPVRVKYTIENKGIDLKIPFKDNLKFLDSNTNFEIRIADIAAIIYNRHWNGNGIKAHYESLRNKSAAKNEHEQLLFKDFDLDFELEEIRKEMF